ncbi:MAG: glycoside-pentoside-hexuronide (GPH):cation symporter [Pseudomonadota bacterium]
MSQKLPPMQLAGYGAADFGFNLFWTGLSVYLLIYYTDILGIDPVTAGLIFSLSIFWDAVSDPIMGFIVTRTKTRWGRFRPYLLFGAPLMGFSSVMMFAAPILFPSAIVLSSAIAHLVFRTCYTIVNIPYGALSAVLTVDTGDRTRLSGARMFCGIAGALFATVMMPGLAEAFGGGNLKRGWVMVGALFAVIATAIILFTFAVTKENEGLSAGAKVSLNDSVRFVMSNRALWVIFVAALVFSVGNGIANKSAVYFIKYNLGAEAKTGPLLGLQALMAALSIPFWAWLAGKTSKQIAWIVGMLLLGTVQLTAFLLAPSAAGEMLPFFALIGFCFGAFAVMFWSTVPDTVEYGQWRSGVRDEGMAFSLSAFSVKTGIAFGVGILGVYLARVGYVPDVEQTERALDGIRAVVFLFPGIASLAVAGILAFYPINKTSHAEIVASLADGSAPLNPQETAS